MSQTIDFLRRIAGSLTKKIGKSGQNQLFRTSAWMHVGRTPKVGALGDAGAVVE